MSRYIDRGLAASSVMFSVPVDPSSPGPGLDEAVLLVKQMGGVVKRVAHREGGCTLTVAVPVRRAHRDRRLATR